MIEQSRVHISLLWIDENHVKKKPASLKSWGGGWGCRRTLFGLFWSPSTAGAVVIGLLGERAAHVSGISGGSTAAITIIENVLRFSSTYHLSVTGVGHGVPFLVVASQASTTKERLVSRRHRVRMATAIAVVTRVRVALVVAAARLGKRAGLHVTITLWQNLSHILVSQYRPLQCRA